MLFIKRSAPETVRSKPALREETVLRIALRITVTLVLIGFSILALGLPLTIDSAPRSTMEAVGASGAFVLLMAAPFLYVVLIFAWVKLGTRRLSIAKGTVPEDASPDDEKCNASTRLRWENLRRRFVQAGTALILVGAVFISVGWAIPEKLINDEYVVAILAAGWVAVLIGVLLLLASLARKGSTGPRSATVQLGMSRAEQTVDRYFRHMLLLTMVLAVFQALMVVLCGALLSVGILEKLPGLLQKIFYWVGVGPIYAMRVSLSLLFTAWVARLVVSRKTLNVAPPPDEPEQTEYGEK